MKRNGGNDSPRRSRRLYSSTERMPLIPKLYTNFLTTFGSASVRTRRARGISMPSSRTPSPAGGRTRARQRRFRLGADLVYGRKRGEHFRRHVERLLKLHQ